LILGGTPLVGLPSLSPGSGVAVGQARRAEPDRLGEGPPELFMVEQAEKEGH
jgi:hypothetical protein